MLSLYIHWPFCLSKCPYCDFNSHVRAGSDEPRMVAALLGEMRAWFAARGGHQTPLASIFFGGGTPSLMAPASVAALIDEAQKLFSFSANIEITLEANPTSSEAEKFRAFQQAGVNRLSLGVQALDNAALKALGREHDVDEALRAIAIAKDIFPRHSFDLIYARKDQEIGAWQDELERALSLMPSHLSLYQLTIEPGTVFANRAASGETLNAPDSIADDMYALTQSLLRKAGLPAYEVSNHAKLGEESRHNLAYWNYQEYIGIGPGAHGRVRLADGSWRASATLRPPEMWLRRVEEKQLGLESLTPLSLEEQMTEALMMHLRLFEGIDKTRWQQRFDAPLGDFMHTQNAAFLLQEGYAAESKTHFRITEKGMIKLNAITGKLLG